MPRPVEPAPDIPMLERQHELAVVAESTAAAASGAGRTLLIEGQPGVGKTRLARAAADIARQAGLRVLAGAGASLEHDLTWGVVRSVLGPELSDSERRAALLQGAAGVLTPLFSAAETAGAPERPAAILHGLYWLVADLAAEQPLAVIVDDTHWADAPSTRWLAHLAARIADLPVLLMLTARPTSTSDWWPAVAASSEARLISLAPLTRPATRALVAEQLPDASASVIDACYQATAGNPFLLRELLRHMSSRDGITRPEQIRALRPESIRRAVLLRLSQLGEQATELCFAIAILGQGAILPLAADLAGLDHDVAATVAASLQAADVIRAQARLQFAHPLVLEVVSHEIPVARRAALHLAAVRLLERRGAPPRVLAPHLLATEPDGDPSAVRTLRAAAGEAMAEGAPEISAACLRRAVDEPPPPQDRVAVLLSLGQAEAMLADPRGVDHLREALASATNPVQRGQVARELALALTSRGEITEAVSLCHSAAAALPDSGRDLRLMLLAHARMAASQDLLQPSVDPPGVDPERLTGDTPAERALLAATANGRTRTWQYTMSDIRRLSMRALNGTALLDDVGADSPLFWNAAMTLLFGEDYATVEQLISDAISDSRRRGSPRGYGLCLIFSSPLHMRLGRLREAADDARRGVDGFPADSLVRAHGLSFLLEALVDLGELEEARAIAGSVAFAPDTTVAPFVRVQGCVARLQRAEGDAAGAAAQLLDVGRRHGEVSPVFFPWRSEAALTLAIAGDGERATELANDALARGEHIGSGWAQARALHALGVAQDSLAPLERAEQITRDRPIRLDRAQVLAELGAALRRRHRTRDAVPVLREALDLADRCGAAPLAARVREELLSAGARPRRTRTTGPDALTPSEGRVARLAAAGATNREIAQTLFVSLRTVETHLTRSYTKLGIAGRDELRAALDET